MLNVDEEEAIKSLWKKKKKQTQELKDLHIWIAVVSKMTNLDVMNLPLEMFWKVLDDMQIILGQKEYDANRKSKRLDSKELADVFGGNKKI